MKCKDCACYKDQWCTMVTDSPDPDMERDCAHFIRARRWIPVTERLPEKEGWYLVFAVTFSDVVFFATSEGWCRLNTSAGRMEPFPYRVTHWMLLPEPPESLRPRGTWEGTADGYANGELVYDTWTCSECGYTVDTDDPDDLTKFCPNCGAKMEGGHNP